MRRSLPSLVEIKSFSNSTCFQWRAAAQPTTKNNNVTKFQGTAGAIPTKPKMLLATLRTFQAAWAKPCWTTPSEISLFMSSTGRRHANPCNNSVKSSLPSRSMLRRSQTLSGKRNKKEDNNGNKGSPASKFFCSKGDAPLSKDKICLSWEGD